MTNEISRLPGVKESLRALNFESICRRFGLVFLLGIMLLAIAGMFSGGYLSQTQATNAGQSLRVDYERFGRLQTEFKLQLSTVPVKSGKYVFSIGGDYSENFETGTIWPQPDSMYSQNNTLFLVYDHVRQSAGFSIWLFITPTKPGKSINTLQVNDTPEISVWQFIYP
ncbi:hypothetical protein [Pseudocitrobacter cyperus]|uniref:Uncharacterized protein n=1 Tax=Pseudocitrobacter cyperus TaxID=3112843 RepID=A0ABV0HJP8_9ENTR